MNFDEIIKMLAASPGRQVFCHSFKKKCNVLVEQSKYLFNLNSWSHEDELMGAEEKHYFNKH